LAKKFYFNLITKNELELISNACSAFSIDYWVIRGYSEDIARSKVSGIQRKNSRKRADKLKMIPKEIRDINNPLTVSYYVNRGFSEDESKIKLKERQSTFSLSKCIERHGEELGYIVWKERQDKWQDSLNSKSEEELLRINKSKDSSSFTWALKKCDGDIEKAKDLYVIRNSKRNTCKPVCLYSKESIVFLQEVYDLCCSLGLTILWKDAELVISDGVFTVCMIFV